MYDIEEVKMEKKQNASSSNEDRRVKRTKKNLRNSLFALLEKKSINQITVTELTTLADVNRSTFYLYYNDIFDMMEKIQQEIYAVFLDTVVHFQSDFSDIESFVTYCTRFLEFCKENYQVCRFITRNDCNNHLAEKIKIAVRCVIPDSAGFFPENDPRNYLTTFALSGILATILEWMNNGMKIPTEDMARFLSYTYVYGSKMQKDSEFYKQYTMYKG